MPKPKVHKGGSPNSEKKEAEDQQYQELRFVRLEDIPIEDAFREKKLFEKGDFERKLNPNHFTGPVIISDEVRRKRIVEVNKLCFQKSDLPGQFKIISDFIAHFPHLIFDADWLKDVVTRVDYSSPDFGIEKRREIFQAMEKGFRRAVDRNPRQSKIQKSYHLSGARLGLSTIQDELSKWNETLDRSNAERSWIAEQANAEADELIKKYTKLRKLDKESLAKCLEEEHCYKAAVFIAHRVFGVRERDLETKSD